MIAKTEKGVES